MCEEELLEILKVDLQISSDAMDRYLTYLLRTARQFIAGEGIVLTKSYGDGMLVEMYAAYLYRRRRKDVTQMPRALRWELNNRLFAKKEDSHG